MPPLLAILPLAAAGWLAPPCPADGWGLARAAFLAAIEAARADRGMPGMAPEAALCAVAQEAAEGEPEPTLGPVVARHRALRARGYRAHRWHERTVIGGGDAAGLLAAWGRTDPDAWRDLVLGDATEVGIGFAPADGAARVVVITALPAIEHERRAAAPLLDRGTVEARTLAAVNALRNAEGLSPLVADPQLARAAQAHAEDMLARNWYGHVSPEGTRTRERAGNAGYRATRIAENAARGLFAPEEVVDRWALSSGHRRNMLDGGVEEAGVGVAVGEREGRVDVLWVLLVARR